MRHIIYTKIWWFKESSVLAKTIIILCILLTVFNISGNIYTEKKISEFKEPVIQMIQEDKQITNEALDGLGEEMQSSMNKLFDTMEYAILTGIGIFISVIVSIFVGYLCSILDIWRKIIEFFAQLDDDGPALKFVFIYDLISILFAVYTIYGLINC